jgi:hypothetical protein
VTRIDEPTASRTNPTESLGNIDHGQAALNILSTSRCLIARRQQVRHIGQYALNVQYAPRPAIPIQRMVGSSRAARCAGEFIHIVPMFPYDPIAAF